MKALSKIAPTLGSTYEARLTVLSSYDPTRTTTLRNQFAREMSKRFAQLRGAIRKAIVLQDCFGLRNRPTTFSAPTLPGPRAFDFPRSGDKVDAFMDWLKRQEDAGILEISDFPQSGLAIDHAWTNKYVSSSYQQGIRRGRQELINANFDVPPMSQTGGMGVAFNQPFHLDRVGLLYTRVFSELKGITASMDSQISRVLSQGMADGKGPIELARILTRTVSGPVGGLGITDTLGRFIPAERRAKILARTEVIRAHHQATIQEYKNWGTEGVRVMAEFATAGDRRVCPECENLNGQIFPMGEEEATVSIENLIPVHPQCRCIALPLDITHTAAQVSSPVGSMPFESGPNTVTSRIAIGERDPGLARQLSSSADPNSVRMLEALIDKKSHTAILRHGDDIGALASYTDKGTNIRILNMAGGSNVPAGTRTDLILDLMREAVGEGKGIRTVVTDKFYDNVDEAKAFFKKARFSNKPGETIHFIAKKDLPKRYEKLLKDRGAVTPPGPAPKVVKPKVVKPTTVLPEPVSPIRKSVEEATDPKGKWLVAKEEAAKARREFNVKRQTPGVGVDAEDYNIVNAAELREKNAMYEYMRVAPEEEYRAKRQSLLRAMFKRDDGATLTAAHLRKIEEGTDWVPIDMLDNLRDAGLKATSHSGYLRAYYKPSSQRIALTHTDTYDVIAHEIGHAIDDLVLGRTLPHHNSIGTGLNWVDNVYTSNAKGKELRTIYRSYTNGKQGLYTNGDGYYWKDNWLDDYEGRIYSKTRGIGEEWWAVNCQRYSKYQVKMRRYDGAIRRIESEIENTSAPGYKTSLQKKLVRLKQEGQSTWAARVSEWEKAKKRYPELTSFIEDNFGKRVAGKR